MWPFSETYRPSKNYREHVSCATRNQRLLVVSSYLTDILVSDSADLLDVGGGLGNVLQGDTSEGELILGVLGDLDVDTVAHGDSPDELLANEVANFDLVAVGLGVLVDVDVDGEMGVDVAHLVLVALHDTGDKVVDDSTNGSEGGDILAGTVVDLNADDALGGLGEADGQVAQVFGELAWCIGSDVCQPSSGRCISAYPWDQ